jgi:hypothetical protein
MPSEALSRAHLSSTDRQVLQDEGFLVLRAFLKPEELRALEEDALLLQLWAAEQAVPSLLEGYGGILFCYDRAPSGTVSAEAYVKQVRFSASTDTEATVSVCRDIAALAYEALSCCFQRAAPSSIFLYNEQFICKPPTQSIYSAFDIHRDRDYDAADKYAQELGTVAIWAPLYDAVSRQNGALCLVPRSEQTHFGAFLTTFGISLDKPSIFANASLCEALMTGGEAPVPSSHAVLLTMEPGDIVVFADDVWHWSLPNRKIPSCSHRVDHLMPLHAADSPRVAWMAQYASAVIRSKRRQGAPAALAVRLPVPTEADDSSKVIETLRNR